MDVFCVDIPPELQKGQGVLRPRGGGCHPTGPVERCKPGLVTVAQKVNDPCLAAVSTMETTTTTATTLILTSNSLQIYRILNDKYS